ncbi:hypothetical protein [Halocatena pleomorpha]|uniref:Uncharacterized protein n=1 Tax=Halocatena pleomorpha TaxID=1785090 RepID=A0A3P3REM2_9EURY|nr:hypothetical protein [Halocatena pleomorpha]RRJ31845.1 hypothetical protein EIK79_06155 [Halocatena pleomorpha]
MNRRHLLGGVLVGALVLFAFPLVSPVPAQDPAVEVLRDPNGSPQSHTIATETVQYRTLSPEAQRWFDDLPQSERTQAAEVLPIDSPPEPWASFIPNDPETSTTANEHPNETQRIQSVMTYIQVKKDDHYHLVVLRRIEPRPPQQAVALRLGSLVGSIGLFGFAGQQWLEGKQ